MIFSNDLKCGSATPTFSPNGSFLAVCNNYKCMIKELRSHTNVRTFTCLDQISEVLWAGDSLLLACVMKKRNIIQIWSLHFPEWQCKINEGAAGLLKCEWCPDSRHMLTTSDFFIRITLWSLENKNVSYMKYPKNCSKYYDFSRDGKYFVLAERRNTKDFISIFKVNEWVLLKNFSTATNDMDGIKFMNYGHILCWESQFRYNICVYNLNGELIKSLSNSLVEYNLGIKCLRYSAHCQLIVLGNYTAECDILNSINLEVITKINCSLENLQKYKFRSLAANILIYSENDNGEYIIRPNIKEIEGFVPKDKVQGVIHDTQFSCNGLYFFTIYDNEPNVIFIWTAKNISLYAILIHKKSLKAVRWAPASSDLALITGADRIYLWAPHGCMSVKVPNEEVTNLSDIKWNPCDKVLCLISKSSCCIAYLEECDK